VSTASHPREDDLPTIGSVDELAELIGDRTDLYIRWSRGPDADRDVRSKDALTGVELPGLSVNALAVEPWWGDRSRRVWAARRLFDYQHLQCRHEGETHAWVLAGHEAGRGPDNEPLVTDVTPIAWVAASVAEEAKRTIEHLSDDWGTLDRGE
jgi:hypothetical protein